MRKNKFRYMFAVFFILCGLIIGIGGIYNCLGVKYYKGELPIGSDMALELRAEYLDSTTRIKSSPISGDYTLLRYDIVTTDTLELPCKNYPQFIWLAVIIGLIYIMLGVGAIAKKDFIYEKAKS